MTNIEIATEAYREIVAAICECENKFADFGLVISVPIIIEVNGEVFIY